MSTRNSLLTHLKESRGKWVSGAWLSTKLSVSRSAINKHVRNLRQMGYHIEASVKKGYLLGAIPDLVLPDEIRDGLNTRIFGTRDIVFFAETDSTNLQARSLAAAGAEEGTIVVAEKQSRGRGRKGRSWFSPEGGGIYLSLILRPNMTPSEAPVITLMTGVAAAETLLSLTPELDIKIKWPNDILANGKKIAGILTEISTDMDRIDYVVVGFGMNVNLPFRHLEEEIKETATSILIETGSLRPRAEFIRAFLQYFESYYEIIRTEGFESIRERWKELANILGRRVMVEMVGKTVVGEVVDVDADGVLILRDERGELKRVVSGDVKLLKAGPV
jgi:BirA family biotin operon repressor/biotin-[acetyl-CoA-carboxylase] ligase